MYHVKKHYPHSLGLSAAFRQWRASSHCRHVHGYALAFTFEFEASTLDARNWVLDFGGLKDVKAFLTATYDHKLIVAEDDPHLETFVAFRNIDLANVIVMPAVGMEAFAEHAFAYVAYLIDLMPHANDLKLTRVTVAEHEGNSASFTPDAR